MKNCSKTRKVFNRSFSPRPLFLCRHVNSCKATQNREKSLKAKSEILNFSLPSMPALPRRGVTACDMYCFYVLLGPLYPASRCISNAHSHLPEMSIFRQNSGTKTPAAFPGWPEAEGADVGCGGGHTRPSAPAYALCSLPGKWLSGKGLPANKTDLNQ